MLTKEELYQFEEEVKQMYLDGKLRSPLHLSGSIDGFLEDRLIRIFEEIKPDDWVFTTYRSHYHALLKGVSKEWLKAWILDNKSIHVMNKEHKIVTSAIVAGTLPVALGVALGIKINERYLDLQQWKCDEHDEGCIVDNRTKEYAIKTCEKHTPRHVWVFVGDMTFEHGTFHEVYKFAKRNDLPMTFIIEDNGLSTDTPTQQIWGEEDRDVRVIRISYKRKYPHYGVGVFVDFKGDEELKQEGGNF